MALATKVYEQIQKEQAANPTEDTSNSNDNKNNDVKDAEYEEK